MLFQWVNCKMSFSVRLYTRDLQHHARNWIVAFQEGLKKHGFKDVKWLNSNNYKPCDLAVIWGARHPNIIEGQRIHYGDYLILERGYFRDRKAFASCGYNGLNGYADFLAEDSPPDRWEKHGIQIAPWKTDGYYILLMGQVNGDQSLRNSNISIWYQKTINEIREITEMPIYYKPHPLSRQQAIHNVDGFMNGSLEDAFKGAYMAVTFCSNSGVDAILNGISLIAMNQGSMAWSMARNEITMRRYFPDRTQWLYDLAYKQWTLEEYENGTAWEHLKKKYA
jgi:hypothetical protein